MNALERGAQRPATHLALKLVQELRPDRQSKELARSVTFPPGRHELAGPGINRKAGPRVVDELEPPVHLELRQALERRRVHAARAPARHRGTVHARTLDEPVIGDIHGVREYYRAGRTLAVATITVRVLRRLRRRQMPPEARRRLRRIMYRSSN